jgi:hypothetical protein
MEKGQTMRKNTGEITVAIKIKGEPTAVVHALANGLPTSALEGIRDGMIAELEKQKRRAPRKGTRRVSIKVKGGRA